MPAPLWKPGTAPYALWLKNLTPEEYKAHLAERAVRKSLKKDQEKVFSRQTEFWTTAFNNGAIELLQDAVINKNYQAFCAIYDRVIGKPESNVDITSNGNTLEAPTIIFRPRELDEWKDDSE